MASSTKAPLVIIADFETKMIEPRPKYPPKPVSLALKWPDTREYKLMAWGHGDGSKAAGNNCTEKEARAEYKKARDSRYPMLFQNGMFDQDCAEIAWDIPLLPWERYHDTMFLLFLNDPHSPTLALKPCAERYLGIKPEEQDRMYAWIIAHIPAAKQKPSTVGAYISECPYQIVKPYHKGDLTRTGGLFNYLYPLIIDAGMEEAYDRERKLMPILLRNARRGMRVDVDGLTHDLPLMQSGLVTVDNWLRKRLGDINIDSDKQLGEALYNKGIVTDFKRTKTGQMSVSKASLTIDKFKDKNVYQALTYRGQMSTSINMFMGPWLDLSQYDGMLHGDWSQVRSPKNDRNDTKGARSGRIICSKPNLLNIPKKWKRSITAGYVHPTFVKVPELPFMRRYVLPSAGKQWGRRDYNQQEVRLFGHFEDGPVMQGFLSNPRFDMHEGVRAAEERALIDAGLRTEFSRDDAKGTVFGAFYGQSVTGLMMSLKLRDPEDRPVGQLIHKALHGAAPSIKMLSSQLTALAKDKSPDYPNGHPICTWGGRLYYCEPPQYSEKFSRDMTFEYKLISYLIQGSGADVIKEAIIRYYDHPKRQEELNVTVYDEIDIDLPMSQRGARQEMKVLRECMQSIECDVPMLSDGEVGPSWGNLIAWKD
jgi:DNA polymerase I-like protein with 3'-5' exonuclease and polymerase domains